MNAPRAIARFLAHFISRAPRIVLLAVVVVLGTAGWARARITARVAATAARAPGDTVVVWGADTLRITNGSGANFVEVLGVAPVAGKQYLLKVTRVGSGSLTKSDVTVNRWPEVQVSDLPTTGTTVTRALVLTGTDTVKVNLGGAVGSGVVVSVLSTSDATVPIYTQTYVRGQSITVFTNTFTAPSTAGQPAYLFVTNGDSTGANPSTADIALNGTTIVVKDNFTHLVPRFMIPVTLGAGTNTVTVTFHAAAPEQFKLQIRATTTAHPTLTITSPAQNLITNHTSLAVSGTVTDATTVTVTVNGVTATLGSGNSYSATVPLANEGVNTITVHAVNAAGLATDSTRTVTRDTHAPTLSVTAPADGSLTRNTSATVSGSVVDATAVSVTVNGVPVGLGNGGTFSTSVTLNEGANFIIVQATDAAGNVTTVSRQVTRDDTPPVMSVTSPVNGSTTTTATVAVTGTAQDASAVTVTVNGAPVTLGQNGAFSTNVTLQAGSNIITIVATDAAGNATTVTRTVTFTSGGITPTPMTEVLPADAAIGAPALNPTVAAPTALSTAFLYSGPNPVQVGVAVGAVDSVRAGALRGRVTDVNAQPMSGVTVSVLGHPELGHTVSRANGLWDLAVNGGGKVGVQFSRSGFLSTQRNATLQWQEIRALDDVAMTALATDVATIQFTQPIEIARGRVETDASGARRTRALFRQGTQATLVMPNGSTQSASSLNMRITEYTVGPTGHKAMPADLPASTAYTYAFELSADEAIASGASSVQFSKPVAVYTDNFLGFKVGTAVPVASYDVQKGTWIAGPNGRVIKVLTTNGGSATVDVDGDGVADTGATLDSLGIDAPELTALASEFTAGATVWRFNATHATPYDVNWTWPGPMPTNNPHNRAHGARRSNNPHCAAGCIVEVENQVLRDALPVVGAPFVLSYSSARSLAYQAGSLLQIPVSGPVVDSRYTQFGVQVQVAGRTFQQTLAPSVNVSTSLGWDGLDAYGRPAFSGVATIVLQYYTTAQYVSPPDGSGFGVACHTVTSFGEAICDTTSVPTREPIVAFEQRYTVPIAMPAHALADVGGWNVSAHHSYDPVARVLLLGTGEQIDASKIIDVGRARIGGTAAGVSSGDGGLALAASFQAIGAIAGAPDGSVFVADSGASVVRRITRSGTITTIAGTGSSGAGAPGGMATATALSAPAGLALDAVGRLYIADNGNARVLRLEADSTLSLVAGGNGGGDTGDGGMATAAQLNAPHHLVVRASGSLLIEDVGANRVREVTSDGIIHAFAGTSNACGTADSIAAAGACLNVRGIAELRDGKVVVATSTTIRVVERDGTIYTLGGGNAQASCGSSEAQSGLPASQVGFCAQEVAALSDGSIVLIEASGTLLRKISSDGFVSVVRNCIAEVPLASASAVRTGRSFPLAFATVVGGGGSCRHAATAPDGSLLIAGNGIIESLSSGLPGFSNATMRIPSADGSEVYEFDATGRHLRTLNALTNATLLTFSYDGAGRLASVADADNNVTTIQRDGTGNPSTILSPYAEPTTLTLDATGRLAGVANPRGETIVLGYQANGVLTSRASAIHGVTRFSYDSLGLLIKDQNELNGFTTYTRQNGGTADTVTAADALNRTQRYTLTDSTSDGQSLTHIDAAGLQTVIQRSKDNIQTTHMPDGTSITENTASDPRWGGQARLTTQTTVQLPSGNTATVSFGRKVVFSNALDPLSVVTQTDTLVVAGQTFSGVYNAASRTFTTTSPAGRTSTVTLDGQGRVALVAATGLASASYTYDARGHLATATQGDRTESYTYDTNGRLATLTDPLNRATSFAYDAAGRLTSEQLPGGRTLAFAYDSAGNVTSLTPPGKAAHTFSYNGANLTTAYQAPGVSGSTGTMTYSYSAQKQLATITRADSLQVAVTYDGSGRPSSIVNPDGTYAIGYDASSGHIISLSAPNGVSQSLRYDGGLAVGTTWSGPVQGAVDFTYDNAFRMQGIAVNGNAISGAAYDGDGLPTTIGFLTLSFGSDNGLLQLLSGANATGTWAYDSLAQVRTYAVTSDLTADTLFRAGYSYDHLGRITGLQERIQSDTATYGYSYDAAGRLSQVQKSGVAIAAFTYDLNGNRTQVIYPSQTIIGTYDAQDRLLSYGTTSYAYTGGGELKLKVNGSDSTKYHYDVFGNLRDAYLSNGDHIEYVVDGQQRRIGRKVNGVLTQGWLYQSQLAIAAEVDASGAVTKTFEYGSHRNVPDYMIANGNAYRIVTDQIGSVRLVIDGNGNVVQRIDYDAYGRVMQNTNPGFQPFGFGGGLLDNATGLTRFGARDYDAENGRWTTADPLRFGSGESNLYAYAAGDPIHLADPSGMCPCGEPDRERQLLLGGHIRGGISTGIPGILGLFGDAGVDVGITNTGRLLVNFHVAGGEGIGAEGDVGLEFGVAQPTEPTQDGVNAMKDAFVVSGAAGVGGVGGVNLSLDSDGSVQAALATVGAGSGGEVSVVHQFSRTYATRRFDFLRRLLGGCLIPLH